MNIVLVYAHKAITTCRPLGLLYIAACLEREDHKVHVIDPRPSDPITLIAKVILRRKPDLIGFTCLTPDIFRALDIANEIKKEWQGPIVACAISFLIDEIYVAYLDKEMPRL